MIGLWAFFLTVLYVCSFLIEYHYPQEEEKVLVGKKILNDLQRLFYFALMGIGFLIDLVRMREDRKKAFIFLLLSFLLGGFSGGVGAIQYNLFSYIAGKK